MALIAEEVVEEWLNQAGYFTIRGIKLGVSEMDILAIKRVGNEWDLRHYEVQASVNPVSYISSVPKALQNSEGRASTSMKKRSQDELRMGVNEWISKKFLDVKKEKLRNRLCPGEWSYHFVVGEVKHQDELQIFQESQVTIKRLSEVIKKLQSNPRREFTASGKDLCDLISMGNSLSTEAAK